MRSQEQERRERERQRAAMLCTLRETYPEATEPELARLCDRAERDAETKRQTLSREKMKRLRFILFGKLPEESGQSSGNESRHP